MQTVYWITAARPYRVGIVARPRGGDWLEDEIENLHRAGIEVLVSLLTSEEAAELGLQDEEQFCNRRGIQFFSLPIEDRSVPDELETGRFLDVLVEQVKLQRGVGFHCRAGIGRSSMLSALALVRLGWTPGAAFRAISEARGCKVPDTPEQEQWVQRFARKFGDKNTNTGSG
jgi:protein-tyrosine phosphatase